MTNGMYEIVSNRRIAQDTYEMVLQGDLSFAENPGQFVNIKLEGLYLRRPISICDWDDATLTLIYKVVGKGTQQLAGMKLGKELDLLCGLGNGFDMKKAGEHSLLIGGGVGVPPLYGWPGAWCMKERKSPPFWASATRTRPFMWKSSRPLAAR